MLLPGGNETLLGIVVFVSLATFVVWVLSTLKKGECLNSVIDPLLGALKSECDLELLEKQSKSTRMIKQSGG